MCQPQDHAFLARVMQTGVVELQPSNYITTDKLTNAVIFFAQIPYEGLLSAAASLATPRFHFLFGPVVDGEVIPPSQGLPLNLNIYAHPLEATPASEKFTVPASEADQNFSIMVGFTLGEGQAFFNQTLWDDGLSQVISISFFLWFFFFCFSAKPNKLLIHRGFYCSKIYLVCYFFLRKKNVGEHFEMSAKLIGGHVEDRSHFHP